ncbi:MAG: DEAD/DEAH box helicase family protein [Pyrobaculum sp.]
MVVKIRIGDKVYNIDVADRYFSELISYLRNAGLKYDPNSKTWTGDGLYAEPPRELLDNVPGLRQLKWFSGRYKGNYFVYCGKEPTHLTYTLTTYKRVSCEEYCDEKAEYDYYSCVDACEEEGWNTVLKKTETVRLYWPDDKRPGCWHVPRGLVHRIVGANPPYFVKQLDSVDFGDASKLRDYQRDVVNSIFAAFTRYGGAIAQMATGAGKSYMAGYIAKKLINAGYTVYMTALGVDLITQLKEFAAMHGVDVNKVKAVTIQKLYRKLTGKDIERHELREAYGEDEVYVEEEDSNNIEIDIKERNVAVIIDEVHHVPARTVKEVVKAFGDGWALRLGLSATPWRNDGRDLEVEAWVGPIVEPRITSSYLVERGFLVPAEIHFLRPPSCGYDDDNNWAAVRRLLAKCEKRNKFIADIVAKAPKPVLVLTPLVSHAELLHEMIQGSEVATGKVSPTQRKEIFDKVRRGELDVLIATTIANEGLDLPPLRAMVNALGGKSKTLTLQRVGRIVRPWPGKDKAIVYDLCDNVKYFSDHCREREKLYKTEPAWKIVQASRI